MGEETTIHDIEDRTHSLGERKLDNNVPLGKFSRYNIHSRIFRTENKLTGKKM